MLCCGLVLQVNGEEVIEAAYPGGKCSSSQKRESTDGTETKGSFQISHPVTADDQSGPVSAPAPHMLTQL